MSYLFRGILIGLLFGVPAGAVGSLAAQRAYSFSLRAGLLTGLGSSVADCVYACIGAFGLSSGMAPLDGFLLVTGVFTGTYIWWTALSAGVVAIKKRMKKYSLRSIEKCFGVVLLGFSLVIFVRAAMGVSQ